MVCDLERLILHSIALLLTNENCHLRVIAYRSIIQSRLFICDRIAVPLVTTSFINVKLVKKQPCPCFQWVAGWLWLQRRPPYSWFNTGKRTHLLPVVGHARWGSCPQWLVQELVYVVGLREKWHDEGYIIWFSPNDCHTTGLKSLDQSNPSTPRRGARRK